jgi:hypothetical protein
MRSRLFGIAIALAIMVSAFPMSGGAAAPNLALVGSTSYLDSTGVESVGLCSQSGTIYVDVFVIGLGPILGGGGSGDAFIVLNGTGGFFIQGQASFGDQVFNFDAGAGLLCRTEDNGTATGGFQGYLSDAGSEEYHTFMTGQLRGSLFDGADPGQGRVALYLFVTSISGNT